jgi:hypothetical protein
MAASDGQCQAAEKVEFFDQKAFENETRASRLTIRF